MLSLLILLIAAEEESVAVPSVISEETRACIQEYAPQVEAEFDSLLEGAEFLAFYLCPGTLGVGIGNERNQGVIELFGTERNEPGAFASLIPEDERIDIMVDAQARMEAERRFIGRTLLELRINRIGTERQEDN